MKKKDLTGQTFGKLTVIKEVDERNKGRIMWLCTCECGNKKEVSGINLTKGKTKSCGCLVTIGKEVDLSGKRSGKLTAVKPLGKEKNGMVKWLCACDCGNECIVSAAHFNANQVQSCGCLRIKDVTGEKFGRLTAVMNTGKKTTDKNGSYIWMCQCDCGNQAEVNVSFLLSGHTKSCGCLISENATRNFVKLNKIQIGRNHPSYKHWITDEERAKRRYVLGKGRQQEWRKEILKRDDYTCNICKDRNGNGHRVVLNAHHLDGWNWCKEKRFDEDNGITLCSDCHDSFHRQYGNGNNTKEQFEEYKNKVLV